VNLNVICIATADDSQGPRKLSDKQRDSDVMSVLVVKYRQSKGSDQLERLCEVMVV
jgi:hypothetical protein